MESIFDPGSSATILQRIDKLRPDATAQWGKMNVSQMLAHCQPPMQVGLGEKQLKQSLVGKLFGRIAKKQMLTEIPFKKNLPTDASFVVKDARDFEKEKQLLKIFVQRFAEADTTAMVQRRHSFFGKMTRDEWGVLTWKHLDHHLRQFGA
jgi:hypothetical protein